MHIQLAVEEFPQCFSVSGMLERFGNAAGNAGRWQVCWWRGTRLWQLVKQGSHSHDSR